MRYGLNTLRLNLKQTEITLNVLCSWQKRSLPRESVLINSIEQFSTHPLKDQKQQVGLVLGGATKIKGYFLESARLPEIRGASALLDRINLEDVPALFRA